MVPTRGITFALCASTILLRRDPTPSASAAPPSELADKILIRKNAHTLTLLQGDKVIKSYSVAIGPGGKGPKLREGDSVTPIGRYTIELKKDSIYTKFLRLSYPNADDRKRFEENVANGVLPKTARIGGDIGIHGSPPAREWKGVHKQSDWTLGCVALDDDEIKEIAGAVRVGTVVEIDD